MTSGASTRLISATCGLASFTIAILAGLAVDNPLDHILARAIASLVLGAMVGAIVGAIGERTMADAVSRYKAVRPISSSVPEADPGPAP